MGFQLSDGVALTMASYVDNLYSCSDSAVNAAAMLDDAEQQLYHTWGHRIKDASRCLMVCRGYSGEIPNADRWPSVDAFPCLGHILAPNCSIRPCFSLLQRCMWKSFWSNCGHASLQGTTAPAAPCLPPWPAAQARGQPSASHSAWQGSQVVRASRMVCAYAQWTL